MNKETIMKAKEHYEALLSSKHELVEAKELLKKKDISIDELRSCLEIINRETYENPLEEDLIQYCFHEIIGMNSECNIYVFRGAYNIKRNKKVVEINDYTKDSYLVDQNLEETNTGVVIYPQEQLEFEKENIVLRFSDNNNFIEKFKNFQSRYFEEYMNNPDISQEEVIKKIRKYL